MSGRYKLQTFEARVEKMLAQLRTDFGSYPEARQDGTCAWCHEPATQGKRFGGYCLQHGIDVASSGTHLERR